MADLPVIYQEFRADVSHVRKMAEAIAFHMGALAHDLAELEREGESEQPDEGVKCCNATPCKRPADGSLCGCDDEDEGAVPGVCMGRECDC